MSQAVSHLVPPPLGQALQQVIKVLREEEMRALEAERARRAGRQQQSRANPVTDTLCEAVVEKVVNAIVDRTIETIEGRIRNLRGAEPTDCEAADPCPPLRDEPPYQARYDSPWREHREAQ
ncbi:hypothetical protein [Rhodomicrobium vannielii]|uniref:hypothetical protein n=1 Tax=Rhodomicrobium vannielii TaxID=1069 RepID=UPI000F736374|nr:hypothetical protein [Rhodomicrobium vannielii]